MEAETDQLGDVFGSLHLESCLTQHDIVEFGVASELSVPEHTMDFLKPTLKPKILRTVLYGDQEFSKFELEIFHTPLYQRLYDLKQLGFTDRVFPDAVHSRFNHLVGVAEVVERIAKSVSGWLDGHLEDNFEYMMPSENGGTWIQQSIKGRDLQLRLRGAIRSLRLMALLHDLTHAAYGHTLEDEVRVFKEKHDSPMRQARFFDAIVAQLVVLWADELGAPGIVVDSLSAFHDFDIEWKIVCDATRFVAGRIEEHATERALILSSLKDLELAFRLLLSLDATHVKEDLSIDEQTRALLQGSTADLLISKVREVLAPDSQPVDLAIYRDMYLIDMVGNTICADLLDYARRDSDNAGLRVAFDERVLRYLGVVSATERNIIPGARRGIRLAVQIYTDKIRHDVLSELSAILKARYLIAERMLFHPTKCAAGACLGTAVQLIGFKDIPPWIQALGDIEFLEFLLRCAHGVASLADDVGGKRSGPGETLEEICANAADAAESNWPKDQKLKDIVLQNFLGLSGQLSRTEPELATNTSALIRAIKEHAESAIRIMWKLKARRYPKLSYRLHDELSDGNVNTEKLAEQYSDAEERYVLERKFETKCKLPLGTVYIHCPGRNTNMKIAEAVVVGNDLTKVSHLRNVTKIYEGGAELRPYENEIKSIEQMYKSIWRINVYVDSAHTDKRALVALVASSDEGFGLRNDRLLANETEKLESIHAKLFNILARRKNEFAADRFPEVIEELEAAVTRSNHGRYANVEDQTLNGMVSNAIAHLNHRQVSGDATQKLLRRV